VATKRGAGEFEITRRGANYTARYRLPISADGRRRRKSFTAPSRKQAIAAASAYRDRVELGLEFVKAESSFEEYFGDWLKSETARKNYRPKTVASYSQISKPIIAEIGNVKMVDLTSHHVDRAIFGNKLGSKLAPDNRWMLINLVLKHAFKRKVIEQNPCLYMDPPAVKPVDEQRALSTTELAQIIQTAERLGILETEIKVLAATGLRIGELKAICWDDVDYETPAINVNKSSFEVAGEFGVGPTKSRNGTRSVEISEPVVRQLQNHRAQQEVQAVLTPIVRMGKSGNVAHQNNGLVFPNAAGQLRRAQDFNKSLRKVVIASGVSDPEAITAHTFRHSHSMLALAAGLDLFFLSRRLGHASLSFTADRYGHVAQHTQTLAATVLDDVLGATRGEHNS
jgi:integrase